MTGVLASVFARTRIVAISRRLGFILVVQGIAAAQVHPSTRAARAKAASVRFSSDSERVAADVALRWIHGRCYGLDLSDLASVRAAWFAELDLGCRRRQVAPLDKLAKARSCVVCS